MKPGDEVHLKNSNPFRAVYVIVNIEGVRALCAPRVGMTNFWVPLTQLEEEALNDEHNGDNVQPGA